MSNNLIGVSGVYASALAHRVLPTLQRRTNEAFSSLKAEEQCRTLSSISIIAYAPGNGAQFGTESVSKPRYKRKSNEISVDIVLPEEDRDKDALERLFIDLVGKALEVAINKATSLNELIDPEKFRDKCSAALKEIRETLT